MVGFNERMHNANEATTNELGYAERSSHKDNLIPMNTLGSLILKYGDDSFQMGTGFTDEQRQEIWKNRDKYLGKLASVRYMSVGLKINQEFLVLLVGEIRMICHKQRSK